MDSLVWDTGSCLPVWIAPGLFRGSAPFPGRGGGRGEVERGRSREGRGRGEERGGGGKRGSGRGEE